MLFDKHYLEQLALIDEIAERVQTLSGVALALAHDVVEESRIARGAARREAPINRLIGLSAAHGMILNEARPMGRTANADGDEGTNDFIVSRIIRTHELQSWFIAEYRVHQSPSG